MVITYNITFDILKLSIGLHIFMCKWFYISLWYPNKQGAWGSVVVKTLRY
jgi:hypothetical protein